MQSQKVGPLKLWYHAPASPCGKRVLLVHGLGEHSGRHQSTIDFLLSKGVDVVRFDQRGCGESDGPRQWIDSFEDYVEDTRNVGRWIQRELDDVPLFVLGHSLGGAIATFFATEPRDALGSNGLAGLLLNAPAYKPGGGISAAKIAIGRLINRFAPKTRIPGGLDVRAVSRDAAEVERYKQDPLNCSFNTVRQGNEILDALPRMPDRIRKVQGPVFFSHGTADRLVQYEGTKELFEICPAGDKTLRSYEGAFHEVHNDPAREDYFRDVGNWLDSH